MSFPSVDHEAWRSRVESELAGKDFERALISKVDDLVVQPLYAEQGPDVGAPGFYPFARSAPGGAWEICQRYAHPDIEVAHNLMLQDLMGGATGVWLELDKAGRTGASDLEAVGDGGLHLPSLSQWKTLLNDVELTAISVRLRPGANAMVAAGMLNALCNEQGSDLAKIDVSWGMDPLGALTLDAELPFSGAEAHRQLVELTRWSSANTPHGRACLVSTLGYHDAGASAVQELAYAIATGIQYLRVLENGGLSPAEVHRHIEFNLAVGNEVFVEIAKIRALRMLWSKVLSTLGVTPEQEVDVHACTSQRSLSQRDPWVNALRMTTQTLAAAVGGATSIATQRFDAAHGTSDTIELGRRVARNTQVILNREGGLGLVADPAGGSYYVERITQELASSAWAHMQAIESAGGMAGYVGGRLQEELQATWKDRAAALDTRRLPVLGVSEFATTDRGPTNPKSHDAAPELRVLDPIAEAGVPECTRVLGEGASLAECTAAIRDKDSPATGKKLEFHRDAERFESIRDAVDAVAEVEGRPRVYLACVGTLAQHNARATFANNAFAAGGFEVQQGGGTGDVDAEENARLLVAGWQASSAPVVCLCGTDDAYDDAGAQVVNALREAGCKHVLLAGKPRGPMEKVKLRGAIHLGCDLREVLAIVARECGAVVDGVGGKKR